MFKSFGLCVTVFVLLVSFEIFAPPAWAEELTPDDGASVVMYHRFGEDDYPSTNTRISQLDEHIIELTNGEYTIMPLSEMVSRLKSQEDFPFQSVGVSIDDAYLSVYTDAWPRFKKAGIPFTIFVATNPIDQGYSHYMTWAQIREMAADPLVTVASQTATHLHMNDSTAEQNAADLALSNQRFQDELGFVPNLIAYPYGEFSTPVIEVVKKAGFIAGFGQQSGAFGINSNISDELYRLPRFALNEAYGDLARLKTAASALPLPVQDVSPLDTLVDPDANPPYIGFTMPDDFPRSDQLACFSNTEGKLAIERLGPRVEVRMTQKLPQGRTRLNCTQPASGPENDGRWRWFGRLLYVK
jgi:peptidoglycan/xylan/chitin deacetylase (PgdA/CDA1 family)